MTPKVINSAVKTNLLAEVAEVDVQALQWGGRNLGDRAKALNAFALIQKEQAESLTGDEKKLALEGVGVLANQILSEEEGVTAPVHVSTSVNERANPVALNFFNRVLMKMRQGGHGSIPEAADAMTDDEISGAWAKSAEDLKNGMGTPVYRDRLRVLGELAETVRDKGHDYIASAISDTVLEINELSQEGNGVCFCHPAEEWTAAKSLEVSLHEGYHIEQLNMALKNKKFTGFLSDRGVHKIEGFSDLMAGLGGIPEFEAAFRRNLSRDEVRGILREISSEDVGKKQPVRDDVVDRLIDSGRNSLAPLDNETLTGEGLASLKGNQMMQNAGLEPAFNYEESNPSYALGVQMWESVFNHAKDQGVEEDRLTDAVLTPYRTDDGMLGFAGVKEFFENRCNLGDFLQKVE